MKSDRKFFSFADIFIIIFIICISAFFIIIQFGRDDGTVCVVRHDGVVVDRFALSDIDEPLMIHYDYEESVDIRIEHDGASVISSTCPDGICERTGKITKSGQTVVCLPARMSVSLESSGHNSDVDAVIG